ncbi:holo-[acyl-carrier-protein] synthase [Chitinophaga caeni]|uniref:Holo-[acyl-carrier-protein] synthase n=1 Tax=Chitinophaga caeni TaxID=2029983 RepID=A0A291QUJ3_9BACT|nr:holo-ACP synthase [Chitinophaga caeni]ATL47605.1 holo-[acyl-carrier-protein] synthase [Chitinophaga caeni]
MIIGIGTDLIEVARVASKIGKNQGFRELVFSPAEIEYCEKQANPYESYAARFAGKEAFLKALSTGYGGSGIHFHQIEILPGEHGAPIINLLGEALDQPGVRKLRKIFISLSHVKEMAMAMVVLEG